MARSALPLLFASAMQTGVDAGHPLRGENQRVMGTIKLYEAKNVYSVQSTARWARGLRNCFRPDPRRAI